MNEHRDITRDDPVAATSNSHRFARKPRPVQELFNAVVLQQQLFWTVPETAFMCRVGARTVWRLMADPNSKFPRPRRIGGRTLLSRDAVLAFMAQEDAAR